MTTLAIQINGWSIYAHPLFLDQLEALLKEVERARKKDPAGYKGQRVTKLLAAVLKVAFHDIPSDPSRDVFGQGSALGDDCRYWFRAKFLQQFRLFFRYHRSGASKIIVLAWVNDDTTLRACESRADGCAVFRGMLDRGNPPDDWKALLTAAAAEAAISRLKRARPAPPSL